MSVTIRIRDPRSANGPLTGNIKLPSGTYGYLRPWLLAVRQDKRLKEFFAARLRGEPVELPKEP
jgi:hypothetical protein